MVTNLPPNTTDEQLQQALSPFGSVAVTAVSSEHDIGICRIDGGVDATNLLLLEQSQISIQYHVVHVSVLSTSPASTASKNRNDLKANLNAMARTAPPN